MAKSFKKNQKRTAFAIVATVFLTVYASYDAAISADNMNNTSITSKL